MEGYSNSYDLHRIDEQLEDSKLKLLELHRECERTEIEMCGVSQLKDKGLFVQKSIERRYENVTEELKQVHRKYINCINKVNSQRGIDQQKINSLTLQRDNLKTELRQIKERVDENNRKFTEIKKMTTVQEKKNVALARKLKRLVERTNITPSLKKRVNAVLCDPRITKRNISNSNI